MISFTVFKSIGPPLPMKLYISHENGKVMHDSHGFKFLTTKKVRAKDFRLFQQS